MGPAGSARRVVVGGLATVAVLAAVLVAGCSSQVAGRGTLAEGAGPIPSGPGRAGPGTAAPSTSGPPPAPTTTATATTAPAPTAPAGAIPAAFAGIWTGSVDQPGSVLPRWDAVLGLPQGRTTGTFKVGSFCSGVVTVLSASQVLLVGREVIISDPGNKCAAAGMITLQRTGANQVRMRWVDSDHADNTASGTLTRG
jgi:hypothetical protein